MMHRIKMIGLVLAISMTAAQANAGIIDVKTIIVSSGTSTLQVMEVFALESGSGTDLATTSAGAIASANHILGAGFEASWAINGSANHVPGGGYQFYHSQSSGTGELTIDLAMASSLESLTIAGRIDCCRERDLYNLTLLDSNGATIFTQNGLDARPGNDRLVTVSFASVPEPSMLALMLAGLAGVGWRRATRKA